jgi:endonuclease/exonuclease/phosphatase (EEP) superfamily protein YafD
MRRALPFVARATLCLYVASSVCAWCARWSFWGELAASLSWHLALAGALLALVLCLARRVWESVVATALSLVHAAPFVPLAWGARDAQGGEPVLRVASANLLHGNTLQHDLVPWTTFADADVLVLLELAPEGRAALEELRPAYPHQLVSPTEAPWREGTWGLALVSRLPFVDARVVDLGEGVFPALDVHVRVRERVLHVVALHLPDPSSAGRLEHRRAAVQELARLVPWDEHAIVAGDLNIPTGSPDFTRLLEATRTRDSRRGFGRQATWCASDVPFELALDLDHVLVGDALAVLDRRRLEIPGSDHCGVKVELALR